MTIEKLHIADAPLPRTANVCGQGGVSADRAGKSAGMPAPVVRDVEDAPTACGGITARDSEGRKHASFAGCNANNANAGRTCNCNNAVSNSNDNYARGFADDSQDNDGKQPTSRAASSKTNEDHSANGGCGQGEYGSLPFWDGDATESTAASRLRDTGEEPDMTDQIWQQLESANKKRRLKSLMKFYANRNIALLAVKQACKTCDTAEKRRYYGSERTAVADRMVREITTGSYRVGGYTARPLKRRHKSDKQRAPKVFTLYDRCVQMFVYIVIGGKLNRKVPRCNYSNTPARGILCRDRRYCMMTRIRTATWKHHGEWALTTDIRKFYESVDWRVMMGVVMQTVKDTTTCLLLAQWLRHSGDLPIGMCISPVLSNLLLAEHDEEARRLFPELRFMAAFGDNRLYIGPKHTLRRLLAWEKSFYAGRYGLELKGDHQMWRVASGFRFCKTWYEPGYVRIRGEMRRRAIRMAYRPQSFAGYNGILLKSDSRRLLNFINNNLRILRMSNSNQIKPMRLTGEDASFDEFIGKKVYITDFERRNNNKQSEYYYEWQFVGMRNGRECLFHTGCGSHELKQVGDIWGRDHCPMPQLVTIGKQGRSIYFAEWHVTVQEACRRKVEELGLDLSKLG